MTKRKSKVNRERAARSLQASVRPRSLRRTADGFRDVIIAELRREIRMYHESYAETDGEVRDDDVLHTLVCLRGAIKIIERSNSDSAMNRSISNEAKPKGA